MMSCFCEENKSFHIKVEGDVGAEAIWCDECYSNFNMEDVPISEELKAKLNKWIQEYGKWIHWEQDVLYPNGIQMEDEHNEMGEQLTIEVRKELSEVYQVRFSPSSSARMYARLGS